MNQISQMEEKAYQFCHQDFAGLTTAEAAEQMGITQRRVEQLLQSIGKKAPQLMPILTKQQAQVEKFLNECGYNYGQVAEELNTTVSNIKNIVEDMKKKGIYFEWGKHGMKMLRYDSSMDDGQVKQKF